MAGIERLVLAGLLAAAILTACSPSRGKSAQDQAGQASQTAAPKRIVMAALSDPPVLDSRLTIALEPGLNGIQNLYNPPLAGGREVQNPLMAEQVPTVANGLWKVLPDGRMETIWRLRPGVAWHDGAPFTAHDIAFTFQVDGDRDLPFYSPSAARQQVDRAEALDDRTVVFHWKGPFIDADTSFQGSQLPSHLLEQPYRENKAGFATIPYWSEPPVGVGPFRIREWARSSHIFMDANDRYVAGRPKIDAIEIKLIPDQNTLFANVLAGGIDLVLYKGIILDQAIELRKRWDGRTEAQPDSTLQMWPQLLTPHPLAVGDARFRRALTLATDRQEIADALMPGFSSAVHSYLTLAEPAEFKAQAHRVVKYDYDPRRAIAILEEMGFSRGADSMFRDERGERLSVEIRTITTDINTKTMFSTADYWQRIGIASEPVVIPRQLAQDMEYRATFPGYELVRNPASPAGIPRYLSSATPLPENSYRGNNRSRYMSPEFDALIQRYVTTIPIGERAQILGDMIFHMTDRALVLGLITDVEPMAVGKRLMNVGVWEHVDTWNIVNWDVS